MFTFKDKWRIHHETTRPTDIGHPQNRPRFSAVICNTSSAMWYGSFDEYHALFDTPVQCTGDAYFQADAGSKEATLGPMSSY
eukprot:1646181-Karenia_brevis.AAC.1